MLGPPAPACAGLLLDGADLGAGELGVDEELERVGLLVLLHEPVQARLDDLQGEAVIALADEGGSGGGERLFPARG